MTPHKPIANTEAAADEVLIRRAAAGSQDAWRRLVDRHLHAVTGYAWYLLGDRAEAEDVAQETFVRLLGKVSAWRRGEPSLRAWLHRVATNLSIDRLRARRPQADPPAEDEPAPDAGLDDMLDRQAQLRRALATLSDRQRAAIVLVHYHGFNQREAADLLDLSVEAVESLLARGRRALRTRLAPLVDRPDGGT